MWANSSTRQHLVFWAYLMCLVQIKKTVEELRKGLFTDDSLCSDAVVPQAGNAPKALPQMQLHTRTVTAQHKEVMRTCSPRFSPPALWNLHVWAACLMHSGALRGKMTSSHTECSDFIFVITHKSEHKCNLIFVFSSPLSWKKICVYGK